MLMYIGGNSVQRGKSQCQCMLWGRDRSIGPAVGLGVGFFYLCPLMTPITKA